MYDVVDSAPTFPDGMKACLQFIAKSIKYPAQAIENKEEGQVVVQFIVSKNGKLLNPIVVKSISPLLDAEAIRVVNSMPDWIPGKHKGESHISYRGRKRLRYVLYEAAISLIARNEEFKEVHR